MDVSYDYFQGLSSSEESQAHPLVKQSTVLDIKDPKERVLIATTIAQLVLEELGNYKRHEALIKSLQKEAK